MVIPPQLSLGTGAERTGQAMFRSTCNKRFVCYLAVAFLLSASFGCSYWESRRAKAVARGNQLFQIHCGGCHGSRRLDLEKVPPDLNGVFNRRLLPSGRPATDEAVRSTILTGQGGIMPSFEHSLSEEDIHDIILYLHTLKPPQKPVTGMLVPAHAEGQLRYSTQAQGLVYAAWVPLSPRNVTKVTDF